MIGFSYICLAWLVGHIFYGFQENFKSADPGEIIFQGPGLNKHLGTSNHCYIIAVLTALCFFGGMKSGDNDEISTVALIDITASPDGCSGGYGAGL